MCHRCLRVIPKVSRDGRAGEEKRRINPQKIFYLFLMERVGS